MRGIDLKIDDIWGLDLSMTGLSVAYTFRAGAVVINNQLIVFRRFFDC